MKTTCLLSLCLLAAACNDNGPAPPASDMTVPPDLMTTATADMFGAPDWSCVGHFTFPTPTKASYTWNEHVVDLRSGMGVAGATVKVCALTDAQCTSPSMTGTTDASGNVMLTAPSAPTGIDAYLEITAANYPTILSQVYVRNGENTFDGGGLVAGIVVKSSDLQLIYSVIGEAQDMSKGTIGFIAGACVAGGASGVSVASSAGGTAYYFANNLPSSSATATDKTGFGLVANVPPGTTMITGMENGTTYSNEMVIIRAGAISTVNVIPTM